jgi:hypothetical protein
MFFLKRLQKTHEGQAYAMPLFKELTMRFLA